MPMISVPTASESEPATESPGQRRQWWVLAVLAVAQLMVILDVTIVNIALPSAQADLAFTSDSRQWIVTAYSLSFGALLTLGGRLGDRFGWRRMFLAGAVGFAVASALGGFAQSFAMLVTARALQGVFGALMAPAALGLLTVVFAGSARRAKAFGIWGAVTGAGAALGLLVGGVLTDYLSWRWCLLVNIGIALVALAGGWLLPGGGSVHRPRLNLPSAAVVSAGLFGIVYGLSRAEANGWSDEFTYGPLVAGGVLVLLFIAMQARLSEPLLPLRVPASRHRGGALAAAFTAGAGLFGVFLFLSYFMQELLGYSAALTGVAFLPLLATLAPTALLSGSHLLPRVGPRPMATTGMLLCAGALVMATRFSASTVYWPDLAVPLLIGGAGLGLIFAAAMGTATLGLEAQDAGVGSSLINTAQQVGGSVGIALLSSQAVAAGTSYVMQRLSPTNPFPTAQLVLDGTLAGYHTAFWWAAGFFGLGALVCLVLMPGRRLASAPKA